MKKQPQYYKRIKKLGEGAFGKAYLCECLSDKSLCVIKQVNLKDMTEKEKRDTLKEAKILEAFNHPNIIKFREVYKTKKGKLCIVMNYADGGDLQQLIERYRGKKKLFHEDYILNWFTQVCLALKHCHDRKVIHRDLKSQNIFLMKTGILKLGDFGIAKVFQKTNEIARTMVGTPYYISPEIVENQPYSFKTDIWSIGVILYEMCALKPPFDGNSLPGLAMRIVKGKYSPIAPQYSQQLRDLVKKLLQVKPSRRPNVNEILRFPIIKTRIEEFLNESVRIQEFAHTVLHNEQILSKKNRIRELQINKQQIKKCPTQEPQLAPMPQLKRKQKSVEPQLPPVIVKKPRSSQKKNRRRGSSRNKKSRAKKLSKAEENRNKKIYEQIIKRRKEEEEQNRQRILQEQDYMRRQKEKIQKENKQKYNKQRLINDRRKQAAEERDRQRKQMRKDVQKKMRQQKKNKKEVKIEFILGTKKEEEKEEVEQQQVQYPVVFNYFQNLEEGTHKYDHLIDQNQNEDNGQEIDMMKSIFLPKNQQEFQENAVLANQLQGLVEEKNNELAKANVSMQGNVDTQYKFFDNNLLKQQKSKEYTDREDFDDEISTTESEEMKQKQQIKRQGSEELVKKAQKCKDTQDLEELLVDEVGKENFNKAYKIFKNLFKQYNLTEIEKKFGLKWHNKILPFISEDKREYLGYMILTMLVGNEKLVSNQK